MALHRPGNYLLTGTPVSSHREELVMSSRVSTILVLAVLLVSAATAPSAVHGAMWEKLPSDVSAVIHVDVGALLGTELYRVVVEQYGDRLSPRGEKYAQFIEATGFDPETDLNSITIGVGGEPQDPEGPVYMIVTGTFDRERIDAYAGASAGLETGSHQGLKTYLPIMPDDRSGPRPTLAWLDARTLVAASTPDFPKLIESVRGSGPNATGSSLSDLLSEDTGQLYVAMEIPEVSEEPADGNTGATPRGGEQDMLRAQLQALGAGPMRTLRSLLITLDAESGLDLVVHARADSPENGALVYELLNGYLMMGQAMAAQNPQLDELLRNLVLGRDGSTVTLMMSMTNEEIRAALSQPSVAPAGGAAGD